MDKRSDAEGWKPSNPSKIRTKIVKSRINGRIRSGSKGGVEREEEGGVEVRRTERRRRDFKMDRREDGGVGEKGESDRRSEMKRGQPEVVSRRGMLSALLAGI